MSQEPKISTEHQAPTGEYNSIDYGHKMTHLKFEYDKDFYPLDEDLPDPQVNPVLPGARIPLDKVGIAPVDLPIKVLRRDGSEQVLQAEASLYCSLDDKNAKGLNLSRLYLLMHDKIRDHLTIEGIGSTLQEMADKQGSQKAYCKLRFKYPWTQKALRTRKPLTEAEIAAGQYQTLSNGEKISLLKEEGHIAYYVELEGRYDADSEKKVKFYMTIQYVYSSTCPCSFELAQDAIERRNAAANAHSQRSIMTTTVEFDPENIVWIEELVELHRQYIPTEVSIVVKRRDEQAFAELNGSNLLFAEDAVRIVCAELDKWFDVGRIFDYSVATEHIESLHPWSAIAVKAKGIPNGLR